MVYLIYWIHVSKPLEKLLSELTLEEKYAHLESERNLLQAENRFIKKLNLWKKR
ncbi:hypothetical protein ACS51_09120 [Bacillus cereus]|nr:hypothetical protein ACS51_09120 [Bacillus cereus]